MSQLLHVLLSPPAVGTAGRARQRRPRRGLCPLCCPPRRPPRALLPPGPLPDSLRFGVPASPPRPSATPPDVRAAGRGDAGLRFPPRRPAEGSRMVPAGTRGPNLPHTGRPGPLSSPTSPPALLLPRSALPAAASGRERVCRASGEGFTEIKVEPELN